MIECSGTRGGTTKAINVGAHRSSYGVTLRSSRRCLKPPVPSGRRERGSGLPFVRGPRPRGYIGKHEWLQARTSTLSSSLRPVVEHSTEGAMAIHGGQSDHGHDVRQKKHEGLASRRALGGHNKFAGAYFCFSTCTIHSLARLWLGAAGYECGGHACATDLS